MEILRQRGVRIVEPGTGELACGMVGAGRMAEPEAIAEAVLGTLGRRNDLAGEVVLVTAGGTREALDPVRFIGNRSSGKMGYALAEAARSRGAKVILVSGPSSLHAPAHCELVKVTTAEEMRNAVLTRMSEATLVIKAAAVADYRPVNVSGAEAQAHRTDDGGACADRRHSGRGGAPPPAGAADCGFCRRDREPHGERPRQAAQQGRRRDCGERCGGEGVGIDADTNAATFLTRAKSVELPAMPKRQLADRILDEILTLRRPRPVVVEDDEQQDAQTDAPTAQDRVLSESLPVGAGRGLVWRGEDEVFLHVT